VKTALVPTGGGHAFRLFRLQPHAARDDESVVGKHRSVHEQHLVALDPDLRDLVLVEDDASVQLTPPRPHDLVDVRQPERNEEEARLVDVTVVAVDDMDLRLVQVEAAAQPVRDHRAACSPAEDDDAVPAHAASAFCPRRSSMRSTNSIPLSTARRTGHAAATFSSMSSCGPLSAPVTRISISNLLGVERWS
jgi:hypothetical protein